MCPSTAGFKDWRAMAYSPQTNALYVPMALNCERATFGPVEKVIGEGGVGPVQRHDYKYPKSDGNLGQFLAMDIRTGKVLWRHRTASPSNTAALATAGGLVIGGDWDRHMYAYDATTGKILWQTRLLTSAQGFPITYLARGKQYIAMPAGTGGGSWSTLIPSELAPENSPAKAGNAVFVFALPASTTSSPSWWGHRRNSCPRRRVSSIPYRQRDSAVQPQSSCGHQNSPRSYAEDDGHKLLNSDHRQPLTSRRNCILRSRARMPKWICSFLVGLSLRSLQAEESLLPSANVTLLPTARLEWSLA